MTEEVPSDTVDTETIFRTETTADDLFDGSNLNQTGSLTRGFTIGNRQDFSLDSGLRLDLSGNITEDVTILATLTDQKTPIQPDGSTQNLSEFDRVYIQLLSPIGELELGDVDIELDRSRFARINRRVQGVYGTGRTPYADVGSGLSVTRGQFRLQEIAGLEGVQGPYRLTGAENESFIIVLAGSENVYIDGQRVNRGSENEYIIDYSLGEITFTNNMVITDETRIVVEFQYITQNFTSTLFTAEGREDGLLGGRLSVGATYIREADSDNPNAQLNLGPEEIERLRNLGDDVEDLFVSGADSVGFQENADFILYTRVDTTFNGEQFEIFKNIPGDERGVFRVRFTNVGAGNGAYQRVGGTVNGILYEWVGPGLGSYEPIVRLQAPQSHQMMALQSSFSISDHVTLRGEWAVSDFDRNRFSTIGNEDNVDHSLFGELLVSGLDTRIGEINSGLRQTYIGRKFEFFDRPREIEFDRKWNILEPDREEEELETEFFSTLSTFENSTIDLRAGLLSRDFFEGKRGEVVVDIREDNAPTLFLKTELIESRDDLFEQNGDWFRQRGASEYELDALGVRLIPFFNWEAEKRDQRSLADSLLPSSLQFYDWNPGVRFRVGTVTLLGGFGYRLNKRPFENELVRESTSRSQRFGLEYRPSSNFRSENRLHFRKKRFEDSFVDDVASPRSRGVLIRSANNYATPNRMVEGELLYEANTERRALLQETYIEVGPELGQYVWIDLNNDGVQQLDEFFLEVNPNEGTFIRQFFPSDELFPVIDLNVRSRNRIKIGDAVSRLAGREPGGLENLIWTSLFDIRETSTEENLRTVYLLDPGVFRNPETTISGQLLIQQRLQWQNSDRSFDLALNYNDSRSLFQRSAGVEQRKNERTTLETEYQLTGPLRLLGSLSRIQNVSENSRFPSRNFNIDGWEAEPGFKLFLSRSAQIEWRFGYTDKQNLDTFGTASLTSYKIENRTQLFLFGRLQNNIRIQLRNNRLRGDAGNSAEYELTNGVGTGTNFLWNLNSNYRASSLVRLNLQYGGRTTSNNQIIQTMRLVVSAVF